MYGNDVAVFDSQVVTNHSVDTGTSIIQIIIGEHDQDSVLSLLSLDQDCVASEEL